MTLDLQQLDSTRRLLFEVELKPIQGNRFQPTGFPDLGPATYQAGENACLLLESAQSMANRLEATLWDEAKDELADDVNGISYVRVNDENGEFLTSSVVEAHRLNSPYIEKCEGDFFKIELANEIGVDKTRAVDRKRFLNAMLKFDVNTLLHGVFLESLDGRLRTPRAISAFIEAERIEVAASGGVKNDRVQATKAEGQTASAGFGNVPFHREEFTAEKIISYFSIDLQQIRAYGLGDDVTHLLIVLALYKIRTMLDGDLRLRTACDLELKEQDVISRRPEGFQLPNAKELTAELKEVINSCKDRMQVSTVTYKK